jgi:F420-non-reducing hydrogenase iron-sulfur subunit
MRLQYPGNIRVIRVPCTGKVDVIHILRAFEKGADGVYVVGCLEGTCTYEQGNITAKRRVKQVRAILEATGLGGERVEMFNLSSGDAPLFARYAKEMAERISSLGPNPVRKLVKRGKQAA